ncbi:very short patch repair endonuclease [Acidimicrobiia bacterium EGI L10123]|uniref:very short patch repair endonuclease n=1 Tax=Salinilacustrithrix flava TaxID=2957203 RepID=UPI003D7C2CE4|nr:very short patch repair endonuclease [Acidimicrobiia bacterium EGI L10123]
MSVGDRMSRQATRDTSPERLLRSELHRRGLRFRLHQRPLPGLRRTADIIFTRAKVAVFVDGCFWHRCPQHATFPKTNADWWEAKLQGNVDRDADTVKRLSEEGWRVVRVWEHENPSEAAGRIEQLVRAES